MSDSAGDAWNHGQDGGALGGSRPGSRASGGGSRPGTAGSRGGDGAEAGGGQDDPFAEGAVPHTPPPTMPDDGNREAQTDMMPNRIPSQSAVPDSGDEGEYSPNNGGGRVRSSEGPFQQEDSIYAREGENPLQAHHHEHRTSRSDNTGGNNINEDDPFAQPGLGSSQAQHVGQSGSFGRRDSGSQSFSRKDSAVGGQRRMSMKKSGRTDQPNLHEVMFENKNQGRKSLASSMLSNRHRGGYDGVNNSGSMHRKSGEGDPEDPFGNFGGGGGALGRSNSISKSQSLNHGAPQIVSGGGNGGGGTGHRDPLGGGGTRSVSPGDMTSEDRANAENPEELFMPNMKREQFIPVRVARDKIKQVLSEMAQMKSMHLAALDTMEKQHAFLKAQLESATATYVKKLTSDYNNRVTALENEYKRRLDNLNSNAMDDVNHGVEDAKKKVEKMEEKMMAKVKEREREFEQEQKVFLQKMEQDKQKAADAEAELKQRDDRIEELIIKVKELEMKLSRAESNNAASSPPPAPAPVPASSGADEAKVAELEDKVSTLDAELNQERIQKKAFEQQALELNEEVIELRLQAAKVDKLQQENEQLRAKLQSESPVPASSTPQAADLPTDDESQ